MLGIERSHSERQFGLMTTQLILGLARILPWMLGSEPSDKRRGVYRMDTSSIAGYRNSIEPYLDYFGDEVIEQFQLHLGHLNVRSRLAYEKAK